MPHKTGLDLLESLESRDFYLVFTTAFDRYAVDALQQAFDYLLNPSTETICRRAPGAS